MAPHVATDATLQPLFAGEDGSVRFGHHLAHYSGLNRKFYDPDRQRMLCRECMRVRFDRWTKANFKEWRRQQLEERINRAWPPILSEQ